MVIQTNSDGTKTCLRKWIHQTNFRIDRNFHDVIILFWINWHFRWHIWIKGNILLLFTQCKGPCVLFEVTRFSKYPNFELTGFHCKNNLRQDLLKIVDTINLIWLSLTFNLSSELKKVRNSWNFSPRTWKW